MHNPSGPPQYVSPYANMNVPLFDRDESTEVSSVAQREFASLMTTNTAASMVALKEKDKVHLQETKKAMGQLIDLNDT
ncbi:hypothetical protein JCM8097_002008 [Rhodosporidiobolus ruineniae]